MAATGRVLGAGAAGPAMQRAGAPGCPRTWAWERGLRSLGQRGVLPAQPPPPSRLSESSSPNWSMENLMSEFQRQQGMWPDLHLPELPWPEPQGAGMAPQRLWAPWEPPPPTRPPVLGATHPPPLPDPHCNLTGWLPQCCPAAKHPKEPRDMSLDWPCLSSQRP